MTGQIRRALTATGRLRRREEWQLFGVLGRAHGGLALAWWGLILLTGVLPAAFSVSIGELVGAVHRGRDVLPALVVVGVAFVAIQLLAPVQSQVGANLGDRVSAWLNTKLLDADRERDALPAQHLAGRVPPDGVAGRLRGDLPPRGGSSGAGAAQPGHRLRARLLRLSGE
jgi:hypothetical protein